MMVVRYDSRWFKPTHHVANTHFRESFKVVVQFQVQLISISFIASSWPLSSTYRYFFLTRHKIGLVQESQSRGLLDVFNRHFSSDNCRWWVTRIWDENKIVLKSWDEWALLNVFGEDWERRTASSVQEKLWDVANSSLWSAHSPWFGFS